MKLYALAEEYQQAASSLQELLEAGEIDKDTLEDTLESLSGDLEKKAINTGLHIKNLRADLESLKKVQSEWNEKVKSKQKTIEFFERYLENAMTKTGKKELKNDYVKLSYRKLPDKVECILAPDAWSIITKKPDKKLIKQHLSEGTTLSFATLLTNREGLKIE